MISDLLNWLVDVTYRSVPFEVEIRGPYKWGDTYETDGTQSRVTFRWPLGYKKVYTYWMGRGWVSEKYWDAGPLMQLYMNHLEIEARKEAELDPLERLARL